MAQLSLHARQSVPIAHKEEENCWKQEKMYLWRREIEMATKRYRVVTNKKEEPKTSGTECGKIGVGCGKIEEGCGRAGNESEKDVKEWWKRRTDPKIVVKPGKVLGPVAERRKKKVKRKLGYA